MRIELLFPFIPSRQYLVWATICKEWKRFLDARKYEKETYLDAIPDLKWAKWAKENYMPASQMLVRIARGGSVEAYLWATASKYTTNKYLGLIAAERGHLELVKHLGGWDTSQLCAALKGKHDQLAEWLLGELNLADSCEDSLNIMFSAAHGENKALIKRLFAKIGRTSLVVKGFLYGALWIGNVELHEWGVKQQAGRCHYPPTFLKIMSRHVHNLEFIQYMYSIHEQDIIEWNQDLRACAIHARAWKTLEWVHEQPSTRLFRDADVIQEIAKTGNLERIEWALSKGYGWRTKAYIAAGEYGHLHIIQWAYSKGYEWHINTNLSAAQKGAIDILQWTYDNDLFEGTSIHLLRYYAVVKRQLDVLKWSWKVHPKWLIQDLILPLHAARTNYLDAFQWMITHRCQFNLGTCLEEAYRHESYDVLAYLEGHYPIDWGSYFKRWNSESSIRRLEFMLARFELPVSSPAFVSWAKAGNLSALMYVKSRGYLDAFTEWDKIVSAAREKSHLHVADWALKFI